MKHLLLLVVAVCAVMCLSLAGVAKASASTCTESTGQPIILDHGDANSSYILLGPDHVSCSDGVPWSLSTHLQVANSSGGPWSNIGNTANQPPGCGSGSSWTNGSIKNLLIAYTSLSAASCASLTAANPTIPANQIASPDGVNVPSCCPAWWRAVYQFKNANNGNILRTVNSMAVQS
jgi:hypothetical protein